MSRISVTTGFSVPSEAKALLWALDRMPEAALRRRSERELSLRDAASEIGVGASTLLRFEKGEAVNTHNLTLICEWVAR
jgi:ribosome-binding protein aMBF1 (putative translation factor)